ncbi:MAG: hypothetical protein J7K57_04585 [Palaeococcus sp.]|uniref:hypothetical protein n=1 Tax=Palaeococcus sp. (in: euryarchaeotes) TaxID=2820298 RepID=UPI0025E211DC|nr:hypothetical protein [Palaeococcus sp. (in: euryarchaeotes)]MCD6559133.1 hypothetical protein [Palaeococcus sp. (in: euryarchaeotes)]
MKKVIMLLMLMIMMPLASAQFGSFTTEDKITVVSGGSSDGYITLTNALNIDFNVVSFVKYHVYDQNSNEVQGVSFELIPDKSGEWKKRTSKRFYYRLNVSEGLKGGSYVIELNLWGFTETGKMYIITARLPLEVREKPLELLDMGAYIEGKPHEMTYALNGENLIAYAHIKNFKGSPVEVNATLQLLRGGKAILESRNSFNVSGDNYLLQDKLKIPYNLPEGKYTLKYVISYPKDTFTLSKEYFITFGVRLASMSLKTQNLLEGEENEVYMDVNSDRNINATVILNIQDEKGSTLKKIKEDVSISAGSNYFKFKVPVSRTGKIHVKAELKYKEVLLGEAEDEFLVTAFPRIGNISVLLQNEHAILRVEIENPNEFEISSKLTYILYVKDKPFKWEEKDLMLQKGTNEVEISVEIPKGEEVRYELYLKELGKSVKKEGSFKIEVPPSTTTSTTTTSSTSTISNTNTTTTTPEGGGSNLGIGIAIAAVIILLAILTYIALTPRGQKKRERPKPKKKSPLGRFKRPKIPQFKELKNLPKKKR